MNDNLTVDLYANPDDLPIAAGVPLDEAFPNAGMRRCAAALLRSVGPLYFTYELYPETPKHPSAVFARISPLKTPEGLGNYSRAHDTATYLDAFHKGLSPIVEKLEAAKAELESCGASAATQYEFELAVAAMTDALAAVATEADDTRA